MSEKGRKFAIGDRVTKIKGSSWTGRIVGFYSTALTPVGYCVESETERGSVQIYPEAALAPLQDAGWDKWFCELHPEFEMGHDGCTGAGITEESRLEFALNQMRHARQALAEAMMQMETLERAFLAARDQAETAGKST